MQAQAEITETKGSCKCEHSKAQVTQRKALKPTVTFQTRQIKLNFLNKLKRNKRCSKCGRNSAHILPLQPPCGNNLHAQNDSGQSARLSRCIPSTLQHSTNSSSKYFSGLGERPWLHQLTELGYVPICQRRMHLGTKSNGEKKKSRQACYYNMALSGTPVPSEKSQSCMKQVLQVLHPHKAQNKGTCNSVWTLPVTIFLFPHWACTCEKDP